MDTVILVAALPVVLVCIYVYKKDVDKEPKTLLRKLMLWGVFSIVPVAIVEIILDQFYKQTGNSGFLLTFISVFISVGLIEELGKWIISYKVVYKDKEFNESYDAIVYSVFVSLGFALIENILYVSSHGILTGLLRAFTSVPAHTCSGVLMGYYFSKTKVQEVNNNKFSFKKNMIFSLLIPTVLHTIYDTLIFMKDFNIILFFICTAFLYIISLVLIKNVSNNNVKFDNNIVNDINSQKQANKILIACTVLIIVSIIYGLYGVIL